MPSTSDRLRATRSRRSGGQGAMEKPQLPMTTVVTPSPVEVALVAGFGVLGYLFLKFGCEPAPLLLGFVLGPLLEEQLRRAMLISRGNWAVFIDRPISLALLLGSLGLLAMVILPVVRRTRREAFQE